MRGGLTALARSGVFRDHSLRMVIAVVGVSEFDPRTFEFRFESLMNCGKIFEAALALRVVWLIGDEKERETGLLQGEESWDRARHQLKFAWFAGRAELAGPAIEDVAVDHAVAIEKDASARSHFTDSHFNSFFRRAGWETMACQTTD